MKCFRVKFFSVSSNTVTLTFGCQRLDGARHQCRIITIRSNMMSSSYYKYRLPDSVVICGSPFRFLSAILLYCIVFLSTKRSKNDDLLLHSPNQKQYLFTVLGLVIASHSVVIFGWAVCVQRCSEYKSFVYI